MFGKAFGSALVRLMLHGTPIPRLADFAAVNPYTEYVLTLHTQDPGEDGTQESFEMTYTGWARRAVPLGAGAWNIVNNVASPIGRLEFQEMTGGTEQLATWLSIGTALTGPGSVLLRGRLAPDVQCRLGVIPAIKPDTTITFVSASS